MKEIKDTRIIIIFFIIGFSIILGYSRMYFSTSSEINKLWTNNGQNSINYNNPNILYYLYLILIFASVVAGIYLLYYFSFNSTEYIELRYTGLILFLSFSLIWAHNPFLYSKFVLLMVSIGSILLLSDVCLSNNKNPETIVAIVASSVILIQTFIFDFGIWTGLIAIF